MISRVTRIPFLLVFFGVVGGVAAFGLLGLFIGPFSCPSPSRCGGNGARRRRRKRGNRKAETGRRRNGETERQKSGESGIT